MNRTCNLAASTDKSVKVAGEILQRAMQRKLAYRCAWAYVEAMARQGDKTAMELVADCDAGRLS